MRVAKYLRQYGGLTAALMLLTAGLLWLGIPKLQQTATRKAGDQQNTARIAQAQQEVALADSTLSLGVPTHLALPRLGITLAVLPGYYSQKTATWTLDRQSAFIMQTPAEYASLSTPIIYGHNIPAVFQKLDGVALNEELRVITEDGRELLFRYIGDRVVLPNDNAVLRDTIPNSVLLMTCTGAQFQHRRVLQFEYLGSKQLSMERTQYGHLS